LRTGLPRLCGVGAEARPSSASSLMGLCNLGGKKSQKEREKEGSESLPPCRELGEKRGARSRIEHLLEVKKEKEQGA